jgi:hypothetical protein
LLGEAVPADGGEAVSAPRTTGKGWRLLRKGTVIRHNDEFWSESYQCWLDTSNNGRKVGDAVSGFIYRRKVKAVKP